MADSKTKTTDTTDEDEAKTSLPPGHPQAGYTSPELSEPVGIGKVAPADQEWADKQKEAREEEVETIADHEDEVAKQEVKDREEEQERQQKQAEEDRKQLGSSGATDPGPAGTKPGSKTSTSGGSAPGTS